MKTRICGQYTTATPSLGIVSSGLPRYWTLKFRNFHKTHHCTPQHIRKYAYMLRRPTQTHLQSVCRSRAVVRQCVVRFTETLGPRRLYGNHLALLDILRIRNYKQWNERLYIKLIFFQAMFSFPTFLFAACRSGVHIRRG